MSAVSLGHLLARGAPKSMLKLLLYFRVKVAKTRISQLRLSGRLVDTGLLVTQTGVTLSELISKVRISQ